MFTCMEEVKGSTWLISLFTGIGRPMITHVNRVRESWDDIWTVDDIYLKWWREEFHRLRYRVSQNKSVWRGWDWNRPPMHDAEVFIRILVSPPSTHYLVIFISEGTLLAIKMSHRTHQSLYVDGTCGVWIPMYMELVAACHDLWWHIEQTN